MSPSYILHDINLHVNISVMHQIFFFDGLSLFLQKRQEFVSLNIIHETNTPIPF